jgi:hypothetical protein
VPVVTRFCLALLLTVLAGAISAQELATNDPLDRGDQKDNASTPATAPETASPPEKTPNGASAQGKSSRPPLSISSESICLMVEAAARANGLPVEFFARVIWEESRFRPDEVGPLTRSGAHALGIAQFMPRTAQERRLLDPFNPVQALPKAAEFLRELRNQFGNLGLAAAAYNAGPQRVRDWMAGRHPISAETRHYVSAITGRSIDEWLPAHDLEPAYDRLDYQDFNCPQQVIALLKQQPNPQLNQQPNLQLNQQPNPQLDQQSIQHPDRQPIQQPNQFVGALMQRVELGIASPWGVQLSASFSRDQALNNFEDVAKRYSGILKGSDPMIVRSILRSRGTQPFYQVRIGEPTRAEANALCARIQHAGGPCLVLRTVGST